MAPKHDKVRNNLEQTTEKFTTWLGSPFSIVLHTILFIGAFSFVIFGVDINTVLLVLTTAVSLEAIYLALFIQMSVNKNTKSLADVEEDIEEIAEDVEGIEKDIEEIAEDVEEMQEDVEGIEKDIDELQEDVEEIEKDDDEDDLHDEATMKSLNELQGHVQKIMEELQSLKEQKK